MKGVFCVAKKKNVFIKTQRDKEQKRKRVGKIKENNISDEQLNKQPDNSSQERRFYKIVYKRDPYVDELGNVTDNIYEKTIIVSSVQLQRIKIIPWIKILKIERLSKSESEKFKECTYSFLLE